MVTYDTTADSNGYERQAAVVSELGIIQTTYLGTEITVTDSRCIQRR
jgi:hypothetical protein